MSPEEKDQKIERLEKEVKALRERIAELERSLGLDSQTSSKPPASDGLKKSNQIRTKSLREKGKRASGGQIGHNLLLRLVNFQGDVLRFLTEPDVPFTNNQAERDLRMMKCKQKISGGFRSFPSAVSFANIRSFLSTASKHGLNLLEVITEALLGNISVFLSSIPTC
jgi:hypothetical protein